MQWPCLVVYLLSQTPWSRFLISRCNFTQFLGVLAAQYIDIPAPLLPILRHDVEICFRAHSLVCGIFTITLIEQCRQSASSDRNIEASDILAGVVSVADWIQGKNWLIIRENIPITVLKMGHSKVSNFGCVHIGFAYTAIPQASWALAWLHECSKNTWKWQKKALGRSIKNKWIILCCP